jgi:hypothetical protein
VRGRTRGGGVLGADTRVIVPAPHGRLQLNRAERTSSQTNGRRTCVSGEHDFVNHTRVRERVVYAAAL